MTAFSDKISTRNKKLLLLLVSILLMLLIGEVCLQLVYRFTMKSWLWQYNAFHTTYMIPTDDRRQYTLRPGFADSQIGVTINGKGFRALSSLAEPEANTPIVALLGDSKAFGAGVRDEETYPFQLNQLLSENGRQIRAVNAGVSSYNTRQAIDRLTGDVVPNYRLSAVVFQAPFNDISLLTYYREQWNPDLTWANVRYAGFTPPLPVFQKFAAFYYVNRIVSQSAPTPEIRSRDDDYRQYPDEAMIANLRRELTEFIAVCHQKSIPVVLIPVDPFYYQTVNFEKNRTLPLWTNNSRYAELWKDLVTHYDDLLIDLSRTNDGVYFFDTRKMLDEEDRGKMYIDYIHYSPAGNRRVAQGLYDFMGKNNLLAPTTVKR